MLARPVQLYPHMSDDLHRGSSQDCNTLEMSALYLLSPLHTGYQLSYTKLGAE